MMRIRIKSQGLIELHIDLGDGWRNVGNFLPGKSLDLDVNSLLTHPEESGEECEAEEVAPTPAVIAPSRFTRLKIRVLKAIRRAVAIPAMPIPVATLALSAILYGAALLIDKIFPLRPLKTLTYDIFINQLSLCVAIEKAIAGE